MQTINSILESVIPNSNKSIKFAHLQKLAYQSTLNSAYVIEMTKTSKVVFMKAGNSLVVRWR